MALAVPRDIEDIFRSYHSHCRDLQKSPVPIPPFQKHLLDLVIYSYILNAFENIIQRRAPQLPQPLTVPAQNDKEYPIEVMFIIWCWGMWFQRGMRLTSSCRAPCHLKGPLGRAVTGAGVWPFPGCRGGHPPRASPAGSARLPPSGKRRRGRCLRPGPHQPPSAPRPPSAATWPPLPGSPRH